MKKLLVIGFMLISITLHAGQKRFVVFYFKGKIELISAAKAKILDAPRTAVNSSEKIRLYPGSDVLLCHYVEGSIWLRQPGVYDIDSLADAVTNFPDRYFISEYFSFLVSEFRLEHESMDEYSTRQLKAKGGVIRGKCKQSLIFPPDSSNFIQHKIKFIWSSEIPSDFTFGIYTMPQDGKKIRTFKTTLNSLVLDCDSLMLQTGTTYFWDINGPENSDCGRRSFKLLTQDESLKISTSIDEISNTNDISQELKPVLKAAFYEKNNLFEQALREYEQALTKSPGQEEIRMLYDEFLARYGLSEKMLQQ